MKARLSAAGLVLTLTLACHGTPAPRVTATPNAPPGAAAAAPAGDAGATVALQRRLQELLADPAVSAGTWSIEVRSLATGTTLFESGAHRLLTPASALKSVTLAVTADRLGWDYTFETRAIETGKVENGVLDGDLIIVGSGDPSFEDWDGAASRVFESWAAQLKSRGISAIGGRIVGDDRVFADSGLGSGWMWDDMAFDYSAPASGLQFNEGTAQVVITPGAAAGDAAALALSPSHARVPLVNAVQTLPAGGVTTISIEALPLMPGARLRGTIALDAAPQTRLVSVGNPTLYFANAVRSGMIAAGIDVLGGAVDIGDLVEAPVTDTSAPAMTYRSPPLSVLADTLMKKSQNMYAETFLRTLGRTRSGQGTPEEGRKVVQDVLASWGVPASELLMADGSGLSRYNLITADALVTVLAHVYADERLRGPFLDSLPVAGRAGTLESRLKGTVAEGAVQAKTGSFTNARSIAGYMRTAAGDPLVFAILANNYGVPSQTIDRVSDAILLTLAEFQGS